MLGGLLKKIFQRKKPINAEMISDFDKALYFIDTYKKAKDYKTAIMATRELILKHKTSITYYEEVQRKLYSLEASNIEAISKSATLKIVKVKSILDVVYKRLSVLEKNLLDIERIKQKEEELLRTKTEVEQIKFRKKEIYEATKKKDYSRALVLAKKFVFDFQSNKTALDVLKYTQKLYDKERFKKEKDKIKKERINKTLSEAGIDIDLDKDKNKGFAFWKNLKLDIAERKRKSRERADYIVRMKTLHKFEMLLAKTGSINNIDSIDLDKFGKDNAFAIIGKGIAKDISDFETYGFSFFGKLIGKDKIVGDTFGHFRTMNNKTIFYIGDATGHGVQAGFTVAILSKIFFEQTKNYKLFADMAFNINNQLKEKIKGKSFITGMMFEWDFSKNELKMIGAGHPPLLVYRKDEKKVERIIPGGLALGVRNIANTASIKIRDIPLADGDIICGYTDGILETKNEHGKMYLLDNLERSFEKHAKILQNPEKIYQGIMNDVNDYKGGIEFDDDVSIFIFTRDSNKDLITNKKELELILKEANSKKSVKDLQLKKRTKEEIYEELKREKQERELKIRLDRLERLAKIGEYIKLKQEVLTYYREGFAHDKMHYYLEKAITNEQKVMLLKMEEKLKRKFDTLTLLYKKGEYEIVVKEAMDVIFKNGKI